MHSDRLLNGRSGQTPLQRRTCSYSSPSEKENSSALGLNQSSKDERPTFRTVCCLLVGASQAVSSRRIMVFE